MQVGNALVMYVIAVSRRMQVLLHLLTIVLGYHPK